MAGYRKETTEDTPGLGRVAELEALLASGKIAERSISFATDLVRSCKAGAATPGRLEWVGKLVDQAKVASVAAVDPVVAELETLLSKVPPRDQAFAKDLIRSCKTGGATPNRMKWVNTLRDRALAAGEKTKVETAYDRVALATGLKPSTVKRFVKRLLRHAQDIGADDVLAALERDDKTALAHMAKEYGDATHNCCFCGLDLTDERSTSKGYGPICAAKYGLPWGDTEADRVMVSELARETHDPDWADRLPYGDPDRERFGGRT